ncbi:MAG: hypothetical protein K8R87_13325 [Verrucomicrobia bacterium]|nr:hypothetical protein [Verrucomicrobiota bacterium]
MTKVLFLLSAVVMAVACFFSWQNRQTFVETRLARQKIVRTIGDEIKIAEKAATEVVAIKGDISTRAGELESVKTRLEQSQIKLRNVKTDDDRVTADKDLVDKQIADIRSKVEKLPEGVTLENIGESINKLKTTIAENENKAKQVEETVAAKEKEVKKVNDDVSEIQKRLEERKKLYDRNSLSATIVAVNNDWGFVVINAGKDKDISSDTKLLITRGSETIGKLNIISVDRSKTVAQIDLKSVRKGMSVAPGDRVILETLYQ